MTPDEIVERFATLSARCLEALVASYEGVARHDIRQGMVLVPWDGSADTRDGLLGGIGRFHVHGRGCLFELDSGEVVDIDWDGEGRAVFDSWRILMFVRSAGEDEVTRESLRREAAGSALLRQVRPDWFTWAHRRYDLTRER